MADSFRNAMINRSLGDIKNVSLTLISSSLRVRA